MKTMSPLKSHFKNENYVLNHISKMKTCPLLNHISKMKTMSPLKSHFKNENYVPS